MRLVSISDGDSNSDGDLGARPPRHIQVDGHGETHRLTEMGFVPGAALRVLHHGPFGGRVVALGSARVALDRATTRRLRVAADTR